MRMPALRRTGSRHHDAVGHPRQQREAYDWFALELANLGTAFRWAADHDDLDGAAIASYAGFIGLVTEESRSAGAKNSSNRPAPPTTGACGGVYGRGAVLFDRTAR